MNILITLIIAGMSLIATAIIGFGMVFIFGKLIDKIQDNRLKKNIPKDKKEMGLDPAVILKDGKPIIDKKEDDENDRRKQQQFRYYEKLRAIGTDQNNTARGNSSLPSPVKFNERSGTVSPLYEQSISEPKSEFTGNKRSSTKGFKLPRPTDI